MPPANDNFANALAITGLSGVTAGIDNTSATVESGEPSGSGVSNYHSIWFKWTAPNSGTVVFSTGTSVATGGGHLDTTLTVYTGTSLGALTQVAVNDDNPDAPPGPPWDYTSKVTFSTIAGTEYHIQVGTYGIADVGTVILDWVAPPLPIFNSIEFGNYLDVSDLGDGKIRVDTSGIQFDTYPQTGNWLYIETTNADDSPDTYGIELNDTSGQGIWMRTNRSFEVSGDTGVYMESLNEGINLWARAANKTINLTAANINLDSADGDIHLGSTGITLDSPAYGYLHIQSSGVRLQTRLDDGQPHQLGLAASSTIKLDAGELGLFQPAIFLNVSTQYGEEKFSIIGEYRSIPQYDHRGFLFEMTPAAKFIVAMSDFDVYHGDRPIFVIDFTNGDAPTYHIKTGATWIADL
jgi:hypothetical protein